MTFDRKVARARWSSPETPALGSRRADLLGALDLLDKVERLIVEARAGVDDLPDGDFEATYALIAGLDHALIPALGTNAAGQPLDSCDQCPSHGVCQECLNDYGAP